MEEAEEEVLEERLEEEVWSQDVLTHPDRPLIHSADAPLRVDAQRTLSLLRWDGTHGRCLVSTRHMAGEVTHCREIERDGDGERWGDRESERARERRERGRERISESRGRNVEETIYWIRVFFRLTFTGASLADEPHHEGGAAVALGGRVEGLHHKLMCFGLQDGNV